MVCVRSKNRSQGQLLEKSYVCSTGHIFSPIIMKLGQNVCLDEVLDKFKNGSGVQFKGHHGPLVSWYNGEDSNEHTQANMNE